MRADMHKIIVERPRRGGSHDRWSRAAKKPLEDLPVREGMQKSHSDQKEFTDLLGPLRRWLQAQTGRPWNAVYSEACEVIRTGSTVRNHLKTHLLEMVERHTFVRDGEVWCTLSGWRTSEMPVRELGSNWSFYVDPSNGILRQTTAPKRRARVRPSAPWGQTVRWVDARTALLNLNGCWFEGEMAALPREADATVYDRALHRDLDRREASAKYGKPVYCVAKRQLSRTGLRYYGLKNRIPAPVEI